MLPLYEARLEGHETTGTCSMHPVPTILLAADLSIDSALLGAVSSQVQAEVLLARLRGPW